MKMTKILTIVAAISICFSGNAFAKKVKNPTFKKVRKSLWYLGVDGASMKEVVYQIEKDSNSFNDSGKALPEELERALKKVSSL